MYDTLGGGSHDESPPHPSDLFEPIRYVVCFLTGVAAVCAPVLYLIFAMRADD